MGWKMRGGKRYLYRTRRVDGVVVTEYLGAGPAAEACFEEDCRRRQARLEREAAQRAEQERWREVTALTDSYRAQVRTLAHAALYASGYHLHARAHWRKRTKPMAETAVPLSDADNEILARAGAGDASVRPLLADVLRRNDEVARLAGDLSGLVERAWIDCFVAVDLVVAEALPTQLARLRADLAGPSPAAEERLLADEVVLAWLECRYAALSDAGTAGLHSAPSPEAGQRRDRAQRRYLAAIKMLATVRKLLRPLPSVLDLLRRGVPETAVPEVLKDRAARMPMGVG